MIRRSSAPEPNYPTAREVEQIDIVRLDIMLEDKVGLSFDLEKDDTFTTAQYGDEPTYILTMGERVVQIPKHRVLYIENRPMKISRVKNAG